MRPDAPSPRVPVSVASWPASARADQWHRTTESPARLPGTLRRFPGFNVGVSSAGPATGHCRANDLQSHIGCSCIFFFLFLFRFSLLASLFCCSNIVAIGGGRGWRGWRGRFSSEDMPTSNIRLDHWAVRLRPCTGA
ncbi:hypothetical protein M430DRAFT_186186 [Amorphotheca resinae ATCC 22711]|uniref:Uncharacterized protein n=1 Tax=Amorphotheca resinae ATCC 22711 TaxID=857342 RepID=A0A2T3AQG9_AMORE|nr:hypothetical protein M430DRAFT_186186 [Amorphotheca resinae ATCC 22711]PSS08507.1 hypothetical protein M430DRAFT_186186 [Amorphotheca resinae ATCC 22711]